MHIETAPGAANAPDTPGWHFAVASGILGWILDAFDFFAVVFLFNELAARYSVQKSAILWTMTMTLAFRPIGALLFGALADKMGRKGPLIACVLYFSSVTICSGLAPTYWLFFLCRCLYGIGMGGYWGIGASYAMESAPARMRGVLSGMMQAGYPFGYLCAAVAMQTVAPRFGWHAMFYVGSVLALLIVLMTTFAPESKAWQQTRMPGLGTIFSALFKHMGIFCYLLVLMAAMTSLSHGTQDLYPDFLMTLPFMHGATVLGMKASLGIPVLYNIGAIVGALLIGQLSQNLGRRYAILVALGLSLISMHWWAFGTTVVAITLGSTIMQAGVQGAFGVIPAHLNELSPQAIRGLFPGFVYQLGVLISSPVSPLQNWLRKQLGYSWALAAFELCVIATLTVLMLFGPENHGKDFHHANT
ncbi:MAG: MFS transporter [Acidobacteriaceae bacterium]|nr:MFS transporter [Acidobacteriaceae bacterium]